MEDIRYEVKAGVAVIALDAPGRRNALTPAMAQSLADAVELAESDASVGAIVIHGGRSFCAGADLGVLGNVTSDPAEDGHFRAIRQIYAAFLRLGSAGIPTVAAVRGAAVGAGMNLALAADLRIVASDARLLSGFSRIGLHPGGGHFAMLARVAGVEAAAALGLFDFEVSGSQAARLGLAWQAVDDGVTESVALDIATRVAGDPGLARAMTASFRHETAQPGLPWPAAVQLEHGPQMWSFRRKANPDR